VGLPCKGGDNNTIKAMDHRILRFKFNCGNTTSCVHAYGTSAEMKATAFTSKVLVATSKMEGNGVYGAHLIDVSLVCLELSASHTHALSKHVRGSICINSAPLTHHILVYLQLEVKPHLKLQQARVRQQPKRQVTTPSVDIRGLLQTGCVGGCTYVTLMLYVS
jgi:hypothetical protein